MYQNSVPSLSQVRQSITKEIKTFRPENLNNVEKILENNFHAVILESRAPIEHQRHSLKISLDEE